MACGKQFTTHENALVADLITILDHRHKAGVQFNRTKLLLDIYKSCDHLTDASEASEYLLSTIEIRLLEIASKNNQRISKQTIINTTLEVIKNYDSTAYIKYQSYHPPRPQ